MNDLQSSLFETMKQFSDYTKASSEATITFQGTIKSVKDAGKGIYLVEYLGNSVECQSTNGISYLVGDNVYVLVPNGDFTKNKIILGLIDSRESKNYLKEEDNIIYYEISNNFIDNQVIPATIEMNSYQTTKSEEIEITESIITPKLINDFLKNGHRIFSFSFLAKTELPQEQRGSGNYGVILSLPLKVKSADGGGVFKQEQKKFTLDTSNMKGDPYNLGTWTPQTIYFIIDDQYEIAETKVNSSDPEPKMTISYFCSDFIQDSSKTKNDIFIKSLGFHAVNAISTSESEGLSLTIKASQGIYFTTQSANLKTLTPYLRINGKTTEIGKSSEIYWFRENITIKSDNPSYCSHGGLGWECLNSKTNVTQNEDGTETFDWVTTNKIYEVDRKDVLTSVKYKCVIIYNGNKISKVVTIQNLATDKEVKLESNSPDNVFVKNTGYAHLIAKIRIDNITNSENNRDNVFCTWVRYNKNGNMITGEDEAAAFEVIKTNEIVTEIVKDDQGHDITLYYYATEVRFPLYLIEDFSTFYCSVTYLNENLIENHIGTASIMISVSEKFEYKIIIDNDNIIYKYDVHGTSPTQTKNYDGPDSSKVTSIAPLTYRIYKADGEELSNEEYSYVHYKWLMPKNSLFRKKAGYEYYEDDNYYYTEGYDNYQHSISFYYDIKNKFDLQYAKNSIILEVEINGSELRQTADINFMKEGGNGSNGTIYSAIITFNDMPYGAINSNGITEKLKFVYDTYKKKLYRHDYNSNILIDWSEIQIPLGIKVYRDSDQLTTSDYSLRWDMFDSTTTNSCMQIDSNGKLTLKSGLVIDIEEDYCNIVRATVTVNENNGNNSFSNHQQIIYVYYPIEITFMNRSSASAQVINLENKIMIPSMDGGYDEVTYRSDGTDPQYDSSSKLFTINDNDIFNSEIIEFKDYFNITWSSQHHLTSNIIKPTEVEIVADNKYDNGNSKNYVKAQLKFDSNKEAELRQKKQNQETAQTSAITKKNKLEQNLIALGNFGKAFPIGRWRDNLENDLKTLLDNTTIIKLGLETLQKEVENFQYSMTVPQYTSHYSPKTLEDFYNDNLKDNINILFNDIDSALHQVVSINDIQNLDDLHDNIIDNIQEKDKNLIEWKNEWSIELDIIGGGEPSLRFYVKFFLDRINIAIDQCASYMKKKTTEEDVSPYDKIYTSLSNGYYQDVKNEYEAALAQLTLPAYSRHVRLQAGLETYFGYFDKITSIREFQSLFDNIYKCVSNVFEIVTEHNTGTPDLYGTLKINTTTVNEYLKEIAKENEIITSTAKEIANCDQILRVANYNIKHIRPIVLHFNTYEMSNINGWDGNKIELDENNGYMLGVQIGAGKKENDNSFTGVVIGQRNFKPGNTYEAQLGLFGYDHGKQSIFLNAGNGSAIFGKATGGGQIVIDPRATKALLYSSNFFRGNIIDKSTGLPISYPQDSFINHIGKYDPQHPDTWCTTSGMLIDLSTPEIVFGSGNFSVSSVGILTAKGAIIDGDITAITGHIGNWIIQEHELKSKDGLLHLVSSTTNANKGYIYSDSHSSMDDSSDGFYLSKDGLSIGSNFKIYAGGKAEIEKEGSTIGKWEVFKNGDNIGFKSSDDGIFMHSNSSQIVLGSSKGKIYSGSHDSLGSDSSGFYLSYEGLSIGSKVRISSDGTLRLGKNAYDPNYAACWTISGGGYTYYDSYSYIGYNSNTFHQAGPSSLAHTEEVYIGTNGINLGKKFSVDNEGNLIANNVDLTGKITTTSGKIANFIIGSHDLRSGSIPGVHNISTIDKNGRAVEDSENVGYGNGISSTLDHDSIMLWCGANDSHIGTAPFRIYADGNAVINRWIIQGDTYLDTVLYTADYTGGVASLRSGLGLSGGNRFWINDWRGQSGNTKYIAAWFGEDSRSIADAPILLFHSGEAKIANMIFDNRDILSVDDAINHWRIGEDANGISTLNIDNVSSKDNGQTWNLYIDSNGESHLRVHHVDIIT